MALFNRILGFVYKIGQIDYSPLTPVTRLQLLSPSQTTVSQCFIAQET